jgi:hypothetical protein
MEYRGDAFAKRQHTISRVATQSAREYKFKINERTTTVEEYMWTTHNVRLRYPDAILVVKGDSAYIPMELCHIVPVHLILPII